MADLSQLDALNSMLSGGGQSDIPFWKRKPLDAPAPVADLTENTVKQKMIARAPAIVPQNDYAEKQALDMEKLRGIPDVPTPGSSPDNPQKQPIMETSDTPLVESYPPLYKYEMKSSPTNEAYMSNMNPSLYDRGSDMEVQKNLAESSAQEASDYGQKRLKLAGALLRQANQGFQYTPPESEQDTSLMQRSIAKQIGDMEKTPSRPDMLSQLISAFGPGVLAMAAGAGGSGTQSEIANLAGAGGTKFSMDYQDKLRKEDMDDRKSRLESFGKSLQGIGEIRKGEAEKRKAGLEEHKFGREEIDKNYKLASEILKDLHDNKVIDTREYNKQMVSIGESRQKALEGGAKEVAGISEAEQKRLSQEKMNDADNKAAIERARISGINADKRLKEKPPTESQTNSASAYASMTKAQQAYDRMLQEYKTPPSMSSKWFDAEKSLYETDQGVLMGSFLRTVSDAKTKRQIQSEMDWLGPHLRKSSGAAINVGEYISEGNRFFPRRNDDPATISEKAASRKQQMENYKLGAGKAPIAKIQQPEPVKDNEAVAWAKKNPKDPRALKIMKLNGL